MILTTRKIGGFFLLTVTIHSATAFTLSRSKLPSTFRSINNDVSSLPTRRSSYAASSHFMSSSTEQEVNDDISSQEMLVSTAENINSVEVEEKKLLQQIQDYKDGKVGKDGIAEDLVTDSVSKPAMDVFVSLIEHWLEFPLPDRAEFILDRMEEFYTPSGRLFERIVNAWCFEAVEMNTHFSGETQLNKSMNDDNGNIPENDDEEWISKMGIQKAMNAMKILDRMEGLFRETGDFNFRPALSTYTSVINAFARTSKGEKEMDIAERIRERRDAVYTSPDLRRISFTKDEHIFDILKHLDNREDAFSSLTMKPQSNQTDDVENDPVPLVNTANFNKIIHELANVGKPWAAAAAEDILDYMIECHKSQNRLKPTIHTFNVCINAWAQCSSGLDSAIHAETILEKLNLLQTTDGLLLNVSPNSVSYNTIINAYANNEKADRAEAILSIMENLYKSTGDERIRPDLISFSSVLNAYAKISSFDASAAGKAEDILSRMIQSYKSEVNEDGRMERVVEPNAWCFNTVLNAHAAKGSGIRATLLLRIMEDMADREENEAIRPDTYTYNTVLKALVYSKEKGSMQRAHQILIKMETDFENGNEKVKPDAISYNTMIMGYAQNGGKDAGKAADSILKRLENRCKTDDTMRPSSRTYTSLIKAWTVSGDKGSSRRIEEIMQSLESPTNEHFQPDTSVYNAFLNFWARSGRSGAYYKAESILRYMEKEYSVNGNHLVRPNCRTYTTVIDIIAKSRRRGSPNRALQILEFMEQSYKEGEITIRPNVYTYTAVINCFARSKEKDKAVGAVSTLQKMEDAHRNGNEAARPNEVAYNNVLNACAYTRGDAKTIEEAFKIACLAFDEIRSSDYVRPSHITYAHFLSVCANLMPESDVRDNLVEAVFKRAINEGLVSNLVIRKFEAAASLELEKRLFEGIEDSDENIPIKWCRNIQTSQRDRR